MEKLNRGEHHATLRLRVATKVPRNRGIRPLLWDSREDSRSAYAVGRLPRRATTAPSAFSPHLFVLSLLPDPAPPSRRHPPSLRERYPEAPGPSPQWSATHPRAPNPPSRAIGCSLRRHHRNNAMPGSPPSPTRGNGPRAQGRKGPRVRRG